MDVAREYDGIPTWQLHNMSHSKSEPWSLVYQPGTRHTVIPIALIKSCFSDMEPLPSIPLKEAFSNIPIVDSIPESCEDEDWDGI